MLNFYANEYINEQVKIFLERNYPKLKGYKYGYFIISKKDLNDICIINNYPEWFDLYVKHSHQMADPVVMKALTRVEGFGWSEEIIISSKPAFKKVMLHAMEFDINSGHTYIIHDNNDNLALLSIFNDNVIDGVGLYSSNIDQVLSYFVKTHQKLLFLYDLTKKNDNKYDIFFTKRENEILYWAATGKTYKEIAVHLNMAVSTVKFHMAKIVFKLDAVNAKHAIKLASDLRLIPASSDI
ncbi:MAG: autoinducer binding domain-containing protein [Pantoea sp.]|uniref:helix-turn-helix transcriptional regulator n=1 Tax=Pantoea sp. TaxID=69393 RepID=UPI00238BE07E|nr:LuxR family transcriptional regulator [Pantoea sp.]MDE1187364.1 autoinducer binding domain-containing protein [Pantoea sp.]